MEISAIVDSVEAAKRGKAENEEGGPMTEENEGQRTAAPADADYASKRKNKKKPVIVAGTVAVVLVLAGAGFWVWHEQPSFCNAICHSPMDNYVESYSAGDAGMLVTQHAEAGKNCLDCHNPVITEQLTEVCTWVADDYPMTDDGMLNTGKEIATEEFCTNDGCHNMSDVVNATWGFEGNDAKYNPHSSHQDNQLECGDCHKSHETSTLYCAKCHDLNLPEGWEAANE